MSLVDLSRESPGELTTEICIIGSGPGGATAAWDLAQAGREVLVLEEGGDFTGLNLTQRDGEMYDQLYMDRGGRATSDLSMTILQGRALGGGGVINACDVVPIHDGILHCWQRAYGLTDYSPEALRPSQERAARDLHANPPREDQLNKNNRLLRQGAQALGWRGEVMLHNRVGCSGVGTCLIGCPLDAKKNPRFVAIPQAMSHGARFFTRARAVRIENGTAELKTIRVQRLDSKGYHPVGELTIRAKIVILAANAIGSTALLIASGLGNEHVGRHVSLQPQLPFIAWFGEEVRFFRGIPQAYAVTEFEELAHDQHGWWGFRIEAIAGTPGIVASILPWVGHDGKLRMSRYHEITAALLLLPDAATGVIRVEPSGRLRVDYDFDEDVKARFRAAAKAAARLYLAAGAREVMVPVMPPVTLTSESELDRIDAIPLRPVTAPLLSAHQQGGVRFAPSPKLGGANPDGLVYGTRDVYVFDSSGFPTTSSSHTMAPIIAISHFLSQRLLARS